MSKTKLKIGILLVIAGILYLVQFSYTGIGTPCVFRPLTGYLCPGCGMTHTFAAISSILMRIDKIEEMEILK